MDLLQYKQLEESLKYIEDYMLDNKYSDEELDDMLKAFQTTDDVCSGDTTNKWNIPRNYKNGSTKRQLDVIRGILLSTGYNYGKFEKEFESQKERIDKDIAKNTYKGRTLEDYENMRLEAIDKIKNTEGFAEKLQALEGYALVINEGIEKLAEYKLVKETVVHDKTGEAAKEMINCGFSLTQITNYLQIDMLIIFYLAIRMGRPFKLSPDEEKLIKAARDKLSNEMTVLGEIPQVPEENSLPFNVPKTWEETVMMLKSNLAAQNNDVEIYSSSPITSHMFLKDSDVIIDIKYKRTGFYSANMIFHIFAESLFPAGCRAVTNREHMLLYSKNAKKRENIKYDDKHCVYKNGVWNIRTD